MIVCPVRKAASGMQMRQTAAATSSALGTRLSAERSAAACAIRSNS